MIDGTGLLDTSQVAGTLAGTKIKQDMLALGN